MEYRGGILIANSDLYHHGILGQKWGKRNGPPYPLGSSAHSSAEKKAGWRKSLSNSKNTSYRGLTTPSNKIKTRIDKNYQKDLKKISRKKYKDPGSKERDLKRLKDAYDSYSNIKKENLLSYDDKKRVDDASVLGIKALNEIGSFKNKIDPNDPDSKWWFVNEDQTVGYAVISDLVLQGKTKNEINKIIKDCENIYTSPGDELDKIIQKNKNGVSIMELAYTYNMDKYIDAAIKIKNERQNDNEPESYTGILNNKKSKDKAAKQNADRIVQERLAQKEADEFFEKNKEKILKSGKAKDALAVQSRLSNTELQAVADRLRLNATLADYADKQNPKPMSNWDKIDKAMDKVDLMTKWTKSGIEAWNIMAKMYNVTPQGQKERLPIIGEGGGNKKK